MPPPRSPQTRHPNTPTPNQPTRRSGWFIQWAPHLAPGTQPVDRATGLPWRTGWIHRLQGGGWVGRIAGRRVVAGVLGVVLVSAGCSVARTADQAGRSAPRVTVPVPAVVPTVVVPPQADGLDGTAGAPGPHVCAAIAKPLSTALRQPVTARPNSWSDGGLPALDLCTLLIDSRAVRIGVTALPRQEDTLIRLTTGTSGGQPVPELDWDAVLAESRLVFPVGDRAVRITADGGIDRHTGISRATAITIARAVRTTVPHTLRNNRQADSTCQLSTSAAERFLGTQVQLRRDYRVRGALTCIWGTSDGTVAIVEAFDQPTIPEAQTTPPPRSAPIGQPGYYLPDRGELVFRQGRRVVRVTALTDPAREIPLNSLLTIVEPLLPLFIR